MRVGALPRVGKMHPLGKKTSMQRHHSVMLLRHLFEPPYKLTVQSPVRWLRSGCKRGDDADDFLWR